MTRSTGWSGLIRRASPPRRASASRMAARSTTAGTPVKSWSSTRAVRNAISFSTFPFRSQVARARTSSALTNLPSSFLRRFSRRTFRLKGSRSAFPPPSWERESSRKIVYCRPATSSVDRLPKEFGCVIFVFSGFVLARPPAHLEPRRRDGKRRTVVHEIPVRRRPLNHWRERVRLLMRVHPHHVRRKRRAQCAPDALVAIDRDLHRSARKDANPPA